MRRTVTLLVLLGLTGLGCGGPEDQTAGGGGDVEAEWDADTICDQPGLEWACEEVAPAEPKSFVSP